jgi:hypothetical protein
MSLILSGISLTPIYTGAMLRRSIFSGFHPGKMVLHGIIVIKILQ